MNPCCADARNLVVLEQAKTPTVTRTVRGCVKCGRRHYELEAEVGHYASQGVSIGGT